MKSTRSCKRVCFETSGESLTKQADADSCDVNLIMKKYEQHGIVPSINTARAHFGDFSDSVDYQSSLEAVYAAQESFNRLPAGIRARFENDPGQFIEFCCNPDNLDELRRMGLADPLPPLMDATPSPANPEPKVKETAPDQGAYTVALLDVTVWTDTPCMCLSLFLVWFF